MACPRTGRKKKPDYKQMRKWAETIDTTLMFKAGQL